MAEESLKPRILVLVNTILQTEHLARKRITGAAAHTCQACLFIGHYFTGPLTPQIYCSFTLRRQQL
jgi:hypothetical protein